jgi:E3 ubiquitin-protein ligase DOA10
MRECRYCLSTENLENLIIPCNCEGSLKYVHQSCLKQWIEAQKIHKILTFEYLFTIPCEICKYNIRCTLSFENNPLIAFLKSIICCVNSFKNIGMFLVQVMMIYAFLLQIDTIIGLVFKYISKDFKTKYLMRLVNQVPVFLICMWFLLDLFKYYKNIFYENRKPRIEFISKEII